MTAEDSAARVLTFSRDWAGLTQQGRILISIERIINGDPLGQILAHETAHDVLLKSTQLGWSQFALSLHAFDPAPQGALRRWSGRLVELSATACKYTHEAVATFLPSLGLDADALTRYRARHPQDYLDAADALEWLRARPIPYKAKKQLVFAAGILALAVLDLHVWRRERLHEVGHAEHWFGVPAHRPDRRFPALCRALEALPEADLAAVADGGVPAVQQTCRGVGVDGQRLSFAGVMAAPPTAKWAKELAARVFGPLSRDPSLAVWEREELTKRWEEPLISLPVHTPTLMSVSLTSTTSTDGRIDVNPPIAELRGYPLVTVLHNASQVPVPGVEPVRGDPLILQPGDSALWFSTSDGGGRACHLSPGWFRDWLDAIGDDITLCVRDGAYFFGVPIGEPRLRQRRHVVLVQHRTPQQLVTELPVLGLDERRGPVFMTRFDSGYKDVAYLLLRPEGGSPVVILPTAHVTAVRTQEALLGKSGQVKFVSVPPSEFLTSAGMLKGVIQVLSHFEARSWPPELIPLQDSGAPTSTVGATDQLDPLMDEATRTWEAYVAQPSPTALAAFVPAAERVLTARQLQTAPLARRADVLEAIAGSFLTAGHQEKDEALLRQALALSDELLSMLPADLPGRFLHVRLAGFARLGLWTITGKAEDRLEALRLLRESHTPGFT